MSIILHSEEILETVLRNLKKTESELTVVSAYVKVEALKVIDETISIPLEKKRLLVRFRMDDIISKSSDFELIEYCSKNDWDLFFNFDLHSKIMIFDEASFVLGSANVTLSGLGLSKAPNIESVVYGTLGSDQIDKVDCLFNSSAKMNNTVQKSMEDQLRATKHLEENFLNAQWDDFIHKQHDSMTTLNNMWCSEMLYSSSPYDLYSRDCSLLGITSKDSGDMDLIKDRFMKTKVYRWLWEAFDEEAYFGYLTKKLHSSLIDDPSPYRKDVKEYLSNLLNWVKELEIEALSLDRPNYSERIRKIIIN
ncbi:hypothetical protein LCM20_16745 [Halobacillus litoralis]|uniref:hypothetical protein n=1 Tax=Halobacillus litoralis TaxID=45668 RepID=UPI001CD43451|nr:hypothetical protein [Halobacillus litoralis]MCA0972259.1 hypothetical protein [Halobacillus litoralis]